MKNLPKILIRLDVTVEIEENPIGGLIYADKLHFEGAKLNSRFIDLGNKLGEDNGGKRNDYKHSIVKVFHHQQIKDNEIIENHFLVTIEIELKSILPGFYMLNSKLVDRVGQPYLDKNMLFRVKSEKSFSFDEKVRNFCKEVNSEHNFEETSECLKMNHWKFEQLNRDEIAKHFGAFDSYLYSVVKNNL